MQSLENSQEAFKKPKLDENSKGFEGRQPKSQEQGGGRDYHETSREVRNVNYGYRKGNPRTPHRKNTSDRRRNYQTDRRNMQQAHELNPQIPEFQPRNIDERQRYGQVGVHTQRSMVNNPNQEN
jgi:hypothetical protein